MIRDVAAETSGAPLDPYQALVAAILHRATEDALGRVAHEQSRNHRARAQADAQHFLSDPEALGWWCDLCALDVQPVLRAAAQVLRRAPRPQHRPPLGAVGRRGRPRR
jgi:hypothetical protein